MKAIFGSKPQSTSLSDPTQKAQVIDTLSKLENIEAVYEVKGEFDIVSIVSASCLEEFRNVLQNKIMKIKGVKSTITSVVLKAHKHSKSAMTHVHGLNNNLKSSKDPRIS